MVSSSSPDGKNELGPGGDNIPFWLPWLASFELVKELDRRLLVITTVAALALVALTGLALIHYHVFGLVHNLIVKIAPGIFGADNTTALDAKPTTEFGPPQDDAPSNDDDL